MAETTRPVGITVLSILAALGGILLIFSAVVIGILAGTMTEFVESMLVEYGNYVIPDVEGFVEAMLMIIAAISGMFGIFAILDAYGLWIGAGWAWWLTTILSALGIVGGILSLPMGFLPILINILIIYYFTRPYVKEFFGITQSII